MRPEYYQVRAEPAGQEPESAGTDGTAYLEEFRRIFCDPVRGQRRFGPADERLAADWHRAGVSLETVRRAILLGSIRKPMSLLDRPDGEPGRSLRYFASPLEELRSESFQDCFWQHPEFNLRSCDTSGSGTTDAPMLPEVPVQNWNRQPQLERSGTPHPRQR